MLNPILSRSLHPRSYNLYSIKSYIVFLLAWLWDPVLIRWDGTGRNQSRQKLGFLFFRLLKTNIYKFNSTYGGAFSLYHCVCLEFVCSEMSKIDQKNVWCSVSQSVSKTGGHLGSSLGVIELTVALHYVFEAPEDKITWDVSHQVRHASVGDRFVSPNSSVRGRAMCGKHGILRIDVYDWSTCISQWLPDDAPT